MVDIREGPPPTSPPAKNARTLRTPHVDADGRKVPGATANVERRYAVASPASVRIARETVFLERRRAVCDTHVSTGAQTAGPRSQCIPHATPTPPLPPALTTPAT